MKRWNIECCNLVALVGMLVLACSTTVEAATDFNADGKADLLWLQAGTGTVLMQTMDGPSATSSKPGVTLGPAMTFAYIAARHMAGKCDPGAATWSL
jgi:hypothetical protein